MKKILLFGFAFAFFIGSAVAQNPQFSWATAHGGTNWDTGNDVVSDAQGNVYITGAFSGTADFDPGSGTSNMTSNGNWDAFLMKLDNTGALLWAVQFGGTGNDNGLSIGLDPSGNLFIGGYFEGTVDFDPSPANVNKVSNGQRDMYLTKFDPNGNFIWAHALGSSAMETLNDIFVDVTGNIFLTGEYGALMDFDPTLGYTSMSCQGTDGFVLKLGNDGSFGWVKKIGGMGNDAGYSLVVDNMGGIIVTGTFNAPVDFDNSMATFNINPSGMQDMFLLKLTPTGDFFWAGSCGGAMSEVYPQALSIGANNDIYVCGFFSGAIDLIPGSSSNSNGSNGGMDAFVVKVDLMGTYVWSAAFGGPNTDSASDMIYLSSGDLVITGAFSNTVDFEPGAGVTNASTSGGMQIDVFLLGLDASGNFNFVQSFGGNYNDNGNALHLNSAGGLYLTGNYISDVDMNPGAGTNLVYNSETSTPNAYVSKYSVCAANSGVDVQSACFEYTWIDGNTYYSDNNSATHTLTNAGGCDSVVTLNLTLTPLPDLTITENANTLTVAAGGLQYQWVDCNNGMSIISTANSQSYSPSINGSYAVIVTNGSCSETSNCFSINTIGLGEETATLYQLYPNPTSGMLNFSEAVDCRIVGLDGQVINCSQAVKSINLQFLSSGVYFCEILVNENVIQRERIVRD